MLHRNPDPNPRSPAGIYVPVPTFFQPKKSASYNPIASPYDADTQAAHSVYLAKAGITGLVVLGSTGEAIHLTNKERSEILSSVRRALVGAGFKDYPIVAGTATQNVEETVSQLKGAKEAGAQWGLCLVPGFFAGASTREGIIQWFTAVADQSPIPILIYHYPGVSNNVKVVPSTYATLSKHPNIVGCKLSHGDMSYHAQVASHPHIDHAQFRTFSGLGQQLLPVVAVGGAGAIDGCAGFFPKTVVALYALSAKTVGLTEDEVRRRRELQYKLSAMEELIVQTGTSASRVRGSGWDAFAVAWGLPGGDAAWAKWKECIDAMEEEENSL
ncbi:hypothetical protein PG997_011391 [Apiospora hydei]|uniref:Aldolase n=1 Tax=Apiospora hydei TaxID=1337664 RepID=A0ABR1VIX2_9PEZI